MSLDEIMPFVLIVLGIICAVWGYHLVRTEKREDFEKIGMGAYYDGARIKTWTVFLGGIGCIICGILGLLQSST